MVALLVVFTIFACIAVDAAIQFSRARQRRTLLKPSANPLSGFSLNGVTIPEGIYSDRAHTWLSISRNGIARVGLDEFLLKAVGRIDEILMPENGETVHRGETLFTIRQGDRKLEIPSPVDGVVERINNVALNDPASVRSSAYDQGWLCNLTPAHLATDIKKLSIAEEAADWMQEEVERFQQFIHYRPVEDPQLGVLMQDGGVPTEGILEHMDAKTWNLFSFEFVRVHSL